MKLLIGWLNIANWLAHNSCLSKVVSDDISEVEQKIEDV